MNKKNKVIILLICLVIIVMVFIANIMRLVRPERGGYNEIKLLEENIMSHAEAYRLLSYLKYNKDARGTLSNEIKYTDQKMSGWYDTYVNAVYKMGLIEKNVDLNPRKALTYGECKELTDKIIISNPIYQDIYIDLSFDFVKADQEMSIENFLELYKAIIDTTPEEDNLIEEEHLFVLDNDVTDDGRNRIITDGGLYYYLDAIDYGSSVAGKVAKRLDEYYDKGIQVLSCGEEIIYIKSTTTSKYVLHNVWIRQGAGTNVEAFINGINKNFQAQFKLSTDIEEVIGDITIEETKVTQISIKPDTIQGKVLQTGDDFIEVEKYGKIPLDENYKIYKTYGEISIEPTNSILVGYENTTFVVSEGKISAALIGESIKAENIRVLLNTSGYGGFYHKKAEFTSDTDFSITVKDEKKVYPAGKKIKLTPEGDLLSKGRVIIEPESENGKIQILSIDRSGNNPKYRGRIEVSLDHKGLLIVNELSLEEYLYAVVPSEMPTYYGVESLKVQAVCARSYAYRHLLANSLSEYGAHVDDSVTYQVYNNVAENEDSILAVKDTYGNVIEYEGDIITAYYFSTSCGHTTGVEHVWTGGKKIPFLKGRLLNVESDSKESIAISKNKKKYSNLEKEENFRDFILDVDYDTYDKKFNWYRWNVTIGTDRIKKNLEEQLSLRYEANPSLIQTLVSGSMANKNAVFKSKPIKNIGDIVDVSVLKRGTGGIITELLIEGSDKTIKIKSEYNVRVFLSPGDATLHRIDDSKVENLNLLPSAFFFIDKKVEKKKLKSITLRGGGYGHGVGLSQNGVKEMADQGKKYNEIISYFYEGTELGFIYH